MKLTDYLYASVPSFCIAVPVAQLLPDLAFLQGIEKLGIVGIMAAGILFFVMERRSFISKSGERLGMVEKRLGVLETKVATGNDKVIHLAALTSEKGEGPVGDFSVTGFSRSEALEEAVKYSVTAKLTKWIAWASGS